MSTSSHSGVSSVFPSRSSCRERSADAVAESHSIHVGAKVDRDLVIADPRVSREHAQRFRGRRVLSHRPGQQARHVRQRREGGSPQTGAQRPAGVWRARYRVPDLPPAARDFEYGARIFEPDLVYSNRAEASDLEKLTLFMDAARKLNTIGCSMRFWLRCSTPR